MELPNVGKQCAFESCNQLDFLPIICKWCTLSFCKLHSQADLHECKSSDTSPKKAEIIDPNPKSYPCTHGECKNKELAPIICDKCSQQFCLKHRLPGDHNCKSVPEKDARSSMSGKEKVESIIGRPLQTSTKPKKVSAKNSKTAAKVLEMKLKMKAKGDGNSIVLSERIYLNIQKDSQLVPLFFHRNWTIGKIIDCITKMLKLENKNNVAGAAKWRLFADNDEDDNCGVTSRILLPTEKIVSEIFDEDIYCLNNFGTVHLTLVDP